MYVYVYIHIYVYIYEKYAMKNSIVSLNRPRLNSRKLLMFANALKR